MTQDFATVAEFFRQQFVARAVAKTGAVFTHLTCATDTRMLETALSAVLHMLQHRLTGGVCLSLYCISLALVLARSCCL